MKRLEAKNGKLYFNNTEIEIDVIKKTTNFDNNLLTFDECMTRILTIYDGQDSIKSKKYTSDSLKNVSIMLLDEYKLIYDYDYKCVIRIDDYNVSESYYKFKYILESNFG